MKKTAFPVTNIGSVSLIMTFIVLCLVTFATLSLSGATSEYQYSRKLAAHNQDYYSASSQAVMTLRMVDAVLHAAYTKDRDNYYANAQEALEGLTDITADFSTESPTIRFETPVSDARSLQVVLSLNPPDASGEGYYKITSWKETAATSWEGDDRLKLMTP